jgi:heat shock protein HtpX
MYRAIQHNKRVTVLLIAGYALIVVGLGLWASFALASVWPAIIIIGIAAAWVAVALTKGVKIAAHLADVKQVSRVECRDLYVTVENLAIRNGMPMPIVCITPEEDINAFAIGMSPKNALVGATIGALNALDSTELEAVMSHEMAHIQNYDTRVKIVISSIINSMAFLAMLCWAAVIAAGSAGRDSDNQGNKNGGGAAVIAVVAFVPAVIFSVIAWILGPLFSAAVSRQREYLADASGVEMTRYPDGMVSMLRKLEDQEKGVAVHSPAVAAFYFNNEPGGWKRFFSSTHPPTHKRIARVEEIGRSIY